MRREMVADFVLYDPNTLPPAMRSSARLHARGVELNMPLYRNNARIGLKLSFRVGLKGRIGKGSEPDILFLASPVARGHSSPAEKPSLAPPQ